MKKPSTTQRGNTSFTTEALLATVHTGIIYTQHDALLGEFILSFNLKLSIYEYAVWKGVIIFSRTIHNHTN